MRPAPFFVSGPVPAPVHCTGAGRSSGSGTVRLLSLPEVDVEKIGVIGHSAGANILPYCLYYDTRVKAAVANCGIFEVNSYYAYNRHGTIPASMALPGSVKYGVDTHDYIAAVAPRARSEEHTSELQSQR